MVGQDKGNKDGLLHGLIRRALASPVGFLAGEATQREMICFIGADFRFEVAGQSSVGLIGGGRGQWLGGTMASAEHEPIMGVWGRAPSGVQEQSPWSGGLSHLKLKAFWSLDVQRSRQI